MTFGSEYVALFWIVLFVAQVADVLTTNKVLSQGGRELNPIVAWMMEKFGSAWPVPKVALSFGGAAAIQYAGYPIGILVAAAVVGFVAYRNSTFIR